MSLFLDIIIASILTLLLLVFCNERIYSNVLDHIQTSNYSPLVTLDNPMRIKSASDFHRLVSRKEDTVIFVGAPWCRYCQEAVIPFVEASKGFEGRAFVLEVNSVELTRLAAEIGVQGFPSILKSHRDGTRSVYKGERTVDSFREYLQGDVHVPQARTELSPVMTEKNETAGMPVISTTNHPAERSHIPVDSVEGIAKNSDSNLVAPPSSVYQRVVFVFDVLSGAHVEPVKNGVPADAIVTVSS